jgi:uncharacterized protein YbcI
MGSGWDIVLRFGQSTPELERPTQYKLAYMEGSPNEHSAKLEISNGIVQLMAQHYGRGPTKAKTYVMERYVLVVLEDLLTKAETTMVENDRGQLVRDMRIAFQSDMADEFKGVVEQALGRKVLTYHSQVVFDPPMGFEIFVLEDDVEA